MKIIDRYIARTLVYHATVVMVLLCGLMLLATFIAELGDIGSKNYTAFKALAYTLLTLPKMLYDLFPIGLFIGTLLGLGSLATHNELTILQSSGVSFLRIFRSLIQVALLMMAIVIFMGEFVVPKAEQLSQQVRSQAVTPKGIYQSSEGFWVRDKNNFIKIGNIPSITQLSQISIYHFDNQQTLRSISTSQKAHYLGNEWRLEDIETLYINDESITRSHDDIQPWKSPFNPRLLNTLATKPSSLTLAGLNQYIRFLNRNELDSQPYRMAFWKKISTPFSTVIMMVLALPCVFGLLRSSSLGIRIMVGTLTGILFFLLNNMSSKLSLVYNLSPITSAFTPSLLFLLIAITLITRLR